MNIEKNDCPRTSGLRRRGLRDDSEAQASTSSASPSSSGPSGRKIARLDEPASKRECMICFEEGYILLPPSAGEVIPVPTSDHVAPVCSNAEHLACVNCMVRHIRQQIEDGKPSVLCPAEGCDYILSRADRARFSGSMIDSDEGLNANQEQALTERLIACPGNYRDAPCPARYETDPDQIDRPFPYTCVICDTRFCLGCLAVPEHQTGVDCQAMRAHSIYELTDVGHSKAMKISLTRDQGAGALCKCGIIIQRMEGCNHMTHSEPRQSTLRELEHRELRRLEPCNVEFCYLCRSLWDDCPCTNYSCSEQQQPISCLACSERAIRFQVGTEHFICQGTPAHEFCRTCWNTWDQQHEDLLRCPLVPTTRSGASMACLR